MTSPTPETPAQPAHTRRSVLGWAGLSTAVGVSAFATGRATAATSSAGEPTPTSVPFYGPHQAGITTAAQDRLHIAAYDVTTRSAAELKSLLAAWTDAAARLTQGLPISNAPANYDTPPADSGEVEGLPPANLTITFGYGPTLFRSADGTDRFGLAHRAPTLLQRLPHFPADNLDPHRSDGDLCIQACADDPQVAVHAIRNLTRLAMGKAVMRWSQLGYGRTASTSTRQTTPRNLFGFKDGTANLKAEDPSKLDQHVWVHRDDDPAASWLTGGTYMVTRRIAMNLETWDRTSLREQETLIGRDRVEGAPLSGGHEHTPMDFARQGRGNKPLVDPTSHVFLAHPDNNQGVKMLRRGYNYTDGTDDLGRLDAGLFFIAFVRNPATHYIPMQTRMSSQDALMEYLQHRASALFAVPPGVKQGQSIGQGLFGT